MPAWDDVERRHLQAHLLSARDGRQAAELSSTDVPTRHDRLTAELQAHLLSARDGRQAAELSSTDVPTRHDRLTAELQARILPAGDGRHTAVLSPAGGAAAPSVPAGLLSLPGEMRSEGTPRQMIACRGRNTASSMIVTRSMDAP